MVRRRSSSTTSRTAPPISGPTTSGSTARISRPVFSSFWKDRRDSLQPGDEYDLVDSFAELLGLGGWYEWKPDPGTHEVTETPAKEGTTNPELLRQKHPAAVWFLLDALKRYASMDVEQVRAIAFEIGMLGRSGLDYASAEKKYTLRTIPGETFSGLHLMCLMHAGFKRIAPDLDSGMDLEEPFLQSARTVQCRQRAGVKHVTHLCRGARPASRHTAWGSILGGA